MYHKAIIEKNSQILNTSIDALKIINLMVSIFFVQEYGLLRHSDSVKEQHGSVLFLNGFQLYSFFNIVFLKIEG
ncbi:MAG: hypothetical protein B7Y17_01195 [Sulfuricurvum sp. 24-42-5]|nr:MAG: hypothetical protein B7Y17_01195 [Sulfuricurvum sp. 24-42-5]